MSTQEFPELGCYLLPGHSTQPKQALAEAKQAEALGLGKVWLSERFDVKEAGAICGGALAVTERIHVATAATNLHTRHPQLLAAMCSSLHYMSDGRFELGLARGVAIRNQLMGLDSVGNKKMVDGIGILRQLWRGEKVMGYDGPMGNLPYLNSGDWLDANIPIHFVGFGPKSLVFAGQHFDGAHLHTFITPQGLKKAKQAITQGAEKAGRSASDVKIISVMATLVNPGREDYLKKIVGRMATYMQAPGYAEMLVALNDWNPEVLTTFRADPMVSSLLGGFDSVATLEQLEAAEKLIPPEWLSAAAIGTPEECAQRLVDELNGGADEVCIHASTPEEFAPVIDAYRSLKS